MNDDPTDLADAVLTPNDATQTALWCHHCGGCTHHDLMDLEAWRYRCRGCRKEAEHPPVWGVRKNL